MSRRLAFLLPAVAIAASVALGGGACSEATDGIVPPELPELSEGGGVGSSSGGTSGNAGTSGGGPRPPREAGITASVVLLNEVSASDDWIELVNSGSASIDLGGFQVADADKDTGEPKLPEAITVPEGTSLAAGAFGLVQAGGIDAGKTCPPGPHAFCLHAAFGISNGDGETIFLLGRDGAVLGTLEYPPSAASGSDTWGRIPSGDPAAPFVVNSPTPGSPNEGR